VGSDQAPDRSCSAEENWGRMKGGGCYLRGEKDSPPKGVSRSGKEIDLDAIDDSRVGKKLGRVQKGGLTSLNWKVGGEGREKGRETLRHELCMEFQGEKKNFILTDQKKGRLKNGQRIRRRNLKDIYSKGSAEEKG